jgi:hypothetical protein
VTILGARRDIVADLVQVMTRLDREAAGAALRPVTVVFSLQGPHRSGTVSSFARTPNTET